MIYLNRKDSLHSFERNWVEWIYLELISQSFFGRVAEGCQLLAYTIIDLIAEILVVEISQIGVFCLGGLGFFLQVPDGFSCLSYILKQRGLAVGLLIALHCQVFTVYSDSIMTIVHENFSVLFDIVLFDIVRFDRALFDRALSDIDLFSTAL